MVTILFGKKPTSASFKFKTHLKFVSLAAKIFSDDGQFGRQRSFELPIDLQKIVPITVGLTFSYYCENYRNFVDTSRGQAATIWPTQGSAQEIVTFYTISISAFVPAWKLLKRFGIKMNESNCISLWSVMSNLQLKSINLKMV